MGQQDRVFQGFDTRCVDAEGTAISVTTGGSGPPVLMLHGYPQTHVMWEDVAVALAPRHTVVCPDLRGYGDSAKPQSDGDHAAYSKRALARDQVEVMRRLGHRRFAVVGHDRGARVARRLTLDHPELVTRLAVLDIVPTKAVYEHLDHARATSVWRYFFLVQPPDLPERMIGADPGGYLRWTFDEWAARPGVLRPTALAEYERCFDAATIHASCEDYRAGATIDLAHDDRDADARIACPVLVLWSESGLGAHYPVLDLWREQAVDVCGHAIDCGHFLAEERPAEVAAALRAFLAGSGGP